MKRLLTLALALCLLTAPLSALAEFAFVQLGADTYANPTSASARVSTYKAGTWLEIVKEEGDGAAVSAEASDYLLVVGTDGLTGYVSMSDVFIQSMMDPASIAVVANGGKHVNLRQEASKTAPVLAKVNSGTPMELLSTSKTFDQVSLGGLTGYMVSGLIKTGLNPIYSAYAVSKNGKSINLRSEPTTNGSVLATVPNGSKVSVYILGGGWAEISYRNTRGYMMSKFISKNGPQPAPTRKPTPDDRDFYDVNATMYVANGGSTVRYRTGPGTDYSTAGKCRSGDEVFVLASNGRWSKITLGVGGGVYYMMSKFLVSIMPDWDDPDIDGPVPNPNPDDEWEDPGVFDPAPHPDYYDASDNGDLDTGAY